MSQEEEGLKQAIALIKTGKKSEAVPILKNILKTDRNNELAWLWLSTCADKPEDKIYCFREALKINPNNEQTKKALEQLEPNPTLQPTIEEMRDIPRRNFASRYLIPIIIFVVVLLGLGLAYKLYIDNENAKQKAAEEEKAIYDKGVYIYNFNDVTTKILAQASICEVQTQGLSKVWSDAIDNGKDFNLAIANFINNLDKNGQILEIENSKEDINNKMKLVQTPITGYEEPYTLLIELYAGYSHLCTQATSPTGSLISYNQDVNKTISDISTTVDKLIVMIPALKTK